MRTEAEMDRMEMELNAIESARSTMRYLGYGPPAFLRPHGDTWKQHCDAFSSKLLDELTRGEFWLANPNYRIG